MKKVVAVLLTAVLFLGLCLPAFASGTEYTLTELDMTVTAPEGYITFTRNTTEDDENLIYLGVSLEDLISLYEASNIYLNSLSSSFADEVVVTMIEYDGSKQIFDFNSYSDQELLNTIEEIKNSSELASSGLAYGDCKVVKHPQAKFARIDVTRTSDDGVIYGIQNYTIINGKAINVTAWSYDGEVSDNLANAVDEMVQSIKFTEVLDNPNAPSSSLNIVAIILIIAAVIFVVIIAVVITLVVVLTKKKNKKALDLAQGYAPYPQAPQDQPMSDTYTETPSAPAPADESVNVSSDEQSDSSEIK